MLLVSRRNNYLKEDKRRIQPNISVVPLPSSPVCVLNLLQMLASNNIMYDRRVVRGNTYAAQVVTQSAQRESSRLRQEHERRMRLEALRRRQVQEKNGQTKSTTGPIFSGLVDQARLCVLWMWRLAHDAPLQPTTM